ncbi:MAG: tetratricopeptide repeat protein [Chitinispirillia bacterium]|nr:tetratricopeptide repeat protein [Chitinispirillia bacterium]MCL2241405.1 tetratricopeptide repeat protein [Chitinispirillia bacterium]
MRKNMWMLLVLAMFSFVNADDAGNKNRKANKLYNQGKYEEALKLYEDALLLDPPNGKLKMNRGSAQYKLGDFDGAERSYLDALSSQNEKKVQADAHYNLGNVQYKQGEQLEMEGNAASARGKYSQALENYINTLKLRPNDKDAKWNLQMAHRKVDMLEGQEDKPGDQDQDGGGDKDDQEGGENDKKDDKNKGDDQSKDGDRGDDGQNQENQRQERDMKQEEAQRLIEQYADDADTLNKPRFQRGRIRQPEKDW